MNNKFFKTVTVICVFAGIILTSIFVVNQHKQKALKELKHKQGMQQQRLADTLKKEELPIPITVQEGYGHITEGYKAKNPDSGVIIHIQDIHTNYEAQKNMSKIIEDLIKEKGLKLIMVEGGWGDVSLTYLRSYSDKERRLEVAEEYLKEGKIAGEEYLDITSDYDMDIEGIEEEPLYRKNLEVFFKIEEFREKGTEEITRLKAIVNELKQKIYPKELQELEQKHADYNDEKISLAEFYAYIEKIGREQHIDTTSLENFTKFAKIVKMEENIDFAAVEKQRADLIERLSKILPKETLTPLVTKSLEFRLNKVSPAEYHLYLKQVAADAGIKIKDFHELSKYIEYIKDHEEINTNALFKEADLLEAGIKDLLAKDEEQKNLSSLARVLDILDNFMTLKLIPDDFAYYKENKDKFLIAGWMLFLNEEIKKHNIKSPLPDNIVILDNNLATLVEFYDLANQRDEVFMKNITSLMQTKAQKIAVVITGGFHTPNLTKMLKDQNFSYIIIAPKTSENTDPEQYRYILKYKAGKAE